MNGFAPGDVVVCAGMAGCHFDHTGEEDFPEMNGKTFRVLRVLPPNFRGQIGLVLGYGDPETDDWCAGCFRKIDKSDEGFAAWMRSLKPIKVPAIADTRRMAETRSGSGRSPSGAVPEGQSPNPSRNPSHQDPHNG